MACLPVILPIEQIPQSSVLQRAIIGELGSYISMRKILFIAIAALSSIAGLAQTQSDVNVSEGGYGMVKTNISVSADHTWGAVSDGFGARVSYEAYKNKWITLSANAKYNSVKVDFDEEELSEGFSPDAIGLNDIHVMAQLGATATARTRLFGKPVMAIAMLNTEWGVGGFERISGTAMALLMLRANRNTQFGIGPLVMINTTSKIPAFLVFVYRHRFNQKLALNLYGGMFGLDYNPNKDNLLSVGADIDVKGFYFKPNNENLPTVCRFTYTSFRPMVKYRLRLRPNLYLDMQGGVALSMSCRVNGKNGTKEYFDCHPKGAPFLQAGISYSL